MSVSEQLNQASDLLSQAADLLRQTAAAALQDKSIPANVGQQIMRPHAVIVNAQRSVDQLARQLAPKPEAPAQ